jgi:putative Holliday junction resolvase
MRLAAAQELSHGREPTNRSQTDEKPRSGDTIRTQMKIAGIDYGTVRIGISIADTEIGIATPHETYTRRSEEADRKHFVHLVATEQVGRFVIGLPVHLDGRESRKSAEAREFGDWLGKVTGVPVEYFDERFTTTEADELLGAAKLTKKQRQARRDQLAAQIMLTAYLESGGRGQDRPGGID